MGDAKTGPTTGRGAVRVILAVSVALALAGCSSDAGTGSSPSSGPSSPGAVTKIVYASTVPAGAADEEQYLYSVEVPPGAALAPHTHPGTQLAEIQGGTLTYTVISGTVTVIRQAGMPGEQRVRVTGQTIELHAGDALIEPPGMVHSSENGGTEPVRIIVSALFPAGADMSSPVPAPPTQPIG
jgi:quercetin dioxygenase-like cupin family protein